MILIMKSVYKTGDIGYYDDEKRLIFKGRADNQIKHMGYRIELSEIEHNAMKIGCEQSCLHLFR